MVKLGVNGRAKSILERSCVSSGVTSVRAGNCSFNSFTSHLLILYLEFEVPKARLCIQQEVFLSN